MTVGTGATATSDSRWSERNIRYDLDGNILHLKRYQEAASTPQATLDFSYDGPKRNGYSYDSNGNITCDPLRCFEIRYNLLNLASEVIGHDPEDTAAEGTLLCETVYYADGTSAGVKTPDDGYWTTRYIGSLIYEGEPVQETLEGIVTDVSCIFMQVDPMAEKYYGMTPYAYCSNNPKRTGFL